MRQLENPVFPSFEVSASHQGILEISDEQRVDVLCETSRDAVMKMQPKQEMLWRLVAVRKDLIQDAGLIDISNNTNLKVNLEREVPNSKKLVRSMTNRKLAEKIVSLFELLELLNPYFESSHRSSRSDSTNPKMQVVKDMLQLKMTIDSRAITTIGDSETDPFLKGVALSNAQRERTFSFSRIPQDEALRMCLYCGHDSINEPIENDTIVADNKKKIEQYREATEKWAEYEANVERVKKSSVLSKLPPKPKHPITKKEMKGAPRRPKTTKQILQCHCLQSMCAQVGSTVGSSCPIKCKDTEGNRYAAATDHTCSCPRCKCKCAKAYHPDEIPKILIRLQQKNHAAKMQQKQNPELQTSQFLNSIVLPAVHSANEARNFVTTNNHMQGQGLDDFTQDTFYGSAACNAVMYCEKLPREAADLMRKNFGTSTTVTLPSGQQMDTRTLLKNKNSHGRNNKLNLSDSSSNSSMFTSPIPGMLGTSLHPDFSRLSDEYHQAAMANNPFSCSSLATNSVPDKQNRTIINLEDSDSSDVKPAASGFHLHFAGKGDTPSSTEKNAQAHSMHKRVLARSRSNAKDALDAYKGDKNDPAKKLRFAECKKELNIMNGIDEKDAGAREVRNVSGEMMNMEKGESQNILEDILLWHDDE